MVRSFYPSGMPGSTPGSVPFGREPGKLEAAVASRAMSDLLPRESGFLERDGERLYWESVGEGEAVVLSHGAGGNHAVWFQQVPVFARHRRVITWDHRGFGRSTATGGPTTPTLAAGDLLALLDHLGVGQADLVGQSMGGWTALRAAIEAPNRVRRLVLSNTPGGIRTEALEQAWRSVSTDGFQQEMLGRHAALADSFGDRDPTHAYLYQLLGGFGEVELPKIAAGLVTEGTDRSELENLACSVLFTTGTHDGLFSPDLIRATAPLVPGARVHEFPDAGHSPYFEVPTAWNAVVGEFLGIPVER